MSAIIYIEKQESKFITYTLYKVFLKDSGMWECLYFNESFDIAETKAYELSLQHNAQYIGLIKND